jgi:hypothetical protein
MREQGEYILLREDGRGLWIPRGILAGRNVFEGDSGKKGVGGLRRRRPLEFGEVRAG